MARNDNRDIKGTKNPRATLTQGEVQAIRQRYAEGVTQGALCRIYGVSINTIGRIVRGETWVWLDGGVEDTPDIPLASAGADANAAASLARLQARMQQTVDKLPETTKELLDGLVVKPK